ncbi:MAG TPA: hypothetical protein VD902_16370 [Symbiobacteriaceae bacterium]|nr:hypothetical protein [Symbiobacteriaceae bacterium]
MLLIPVLVLMIAALVARGTLADYKPRLRTKSGESPAEARTILLGTYRVYMWVLRFSVVEVLLHRLVGKDFPAFLVWAGAAGGAIVLILAHAVYWRLGYDGRRWLLVLGHLSGLVGLMECHSSLHDQIRAIAPEAREEVSG